MMNELKVDFGGWIQKGIDVWKENILTLVVSYIILVCVSVVSFGILSGPMFAGYYAMTLALHDKQQPRPQIGDLFKGFSMFLPAFLLFLLIGLVMVLICLIYLIPCVGWVAAPLLSFSFLALTMFAMFHVVDQKLAVIDALKTSIATVRSNFFPFLGFFVVAVAIGGAGLLLCGVGNFVTMPIAFCILTAAYRSCYPAPSGSSATPPPMP